ncbi:hypothetical protein PROSTU_01245 [Providencia stuartii ATCC 25827]|uniref:Uncharacterized protein n=1 Tax=Providencia stuartii ATCC 25827 TaxID=471874 RepID=A0AA86YMY5_PROST|nr:hypothetical protein PROSTU_01245 [Providencia stuartii ATCC 25827]
MYVYSTYQIICKFLDVAAKKQKKPYFSFLRMIVTFRYFTLKSTSNY